MIKPSNRLQTYIEKNRLNYGTSGNLLTVQELQCLYSFIKENNNGEEKIFFHELLENSELILPEALKIPRNPVLEMRCKTLRMQQENNDYNKITKNVDSIRIKYPEDSFGYQMRQINKYLIHVFQFVISCVTGYAFGFFGLELFLGPLDTGVKILLGIGCASVIGLADLYFLAKKLTEDLKYET